MADYLERPIKAHLPWLKASTPGRGPQIAGVMLHSTRSGRSDGDDGPRTEGWWNNPSNKVPDGSSGFYGSYADILVYESGLRVICTDWDNETATWTAGYGDSGTWPAGYHYIQIEIAQGQTLDPFTDDEMRSTAEKVAELSIRYDFPLQRIPFLSQTGTPPRGVCDHENSANGKKYGKSDVGPMFDWERFFSLAQAYREGQVDAPLDQEEDEMKRYDLINDGSGKYWLLTIEGRAVPLSGGHLNGLKKLEAEGVVTLTNTRLTRQEAQAMEPK